MGLGEFCLGEDPAQVMMKFKSFFDSPPAGADFYLKQFKLFFSYGYLKGIPEIVSHFKNDDIIWLNTITGIETDSSYLYCMLRKNALLKSEWMYPLKESVPKKQLINNYKLPDTVSLKNTFSFKWNTLPEFRNLIKEKKINKVGLIISDIPQVEKFAKQDNLEKLKNTDWLVLGKEISLKNKTLFIFNVK